MTKIFISYRREDSADVTGRIGDRLRDQFGEEQIFTDVDNIPLGVDFRAHLDNEVSQCDVLLAVIGKDWLSASNSDGELRLDDPADFVRIEIESALKRDIPVIPLLVRGASVPSSNQLPESIGNLAFRNAQQIRPDPDFKNDANRLVQGLLKHFEPDTPKMEETDLGAQESDHLQTLRHKMLVADDLIGLQRLRYEVEEHLHTAPKSPEARTLLQQITDAEDRQRSLDIKDVSAKNIPKKWQISTPKVAALARRKKIRVKSYHSCGLLIHGIQFLDGGGSVSQRVGYSPNRFNCSVTYGLR